MKFYEKSYEKSLYPFQDGVLKLVNVLETPFYLTGGTALSRFYFNHRYSDDLDFFVNEEKQYGSWMQLIFERLEAESKTNDFSIDYERAVRGENFTQIFLKKGQEYLKLDFVNDVAPHYGGFKNAPIFDRIDSWRNILSNKLTALGRLESKDFVDLWILAKHCKFDWRAIFREAREKDAGLDPVMLYELLFSFPQESLDLIKWIRRIDADTFMSDLSMIANELVLGQENSLCTEDFKMEQKTGDWELETGKRKPETEKKKSGA